jgi:hypothetical protein
MTFIYVCIPSRLFVLCSLYNAGSPTVTCRLCSSYSARLSPCIYLFIYLFIDLLFYSLFIIIFLHGLGRLICSGIDALQSFPGAFTIPSSSRFVPEGVFRESGVVHSLKMVGPVLFVFGSHVLYSRDL